MTSTETGVLRVVVVDDSVVLRQRLVGLLGELDGVEVIGEFEDRDRAIVCVGEGHTRCQAVFSGKSQYFSRIS